ncbi:MAG: hypothetical protein FJ253_08570 [Phycisphaerae bacterium]|nr:hypothetical protein [Phycisphaerae bacterium]
MRDRIIQLIAAIVLVACALGAGRLLPRMLADAGALGLRYTSDPIEGAPPIIALANAIGAIRPLVADYLWIKLSNMKQKGQFYEASSLASWITKLQPRFPEVWGFHGHNLAYNISVLTNSPEERWSLVNRGIDLVRNQGLRYNPNDLGLNKELAFWFAHKVEGVSDDAHLHYKREFAREWHLLLGRPPAATEAREAWIQKIADAPDTFEQLVAKDPAVQTVVDRLTESLSPFERHFTFKLDKTFLLMYGRWQAIQESPYARLLNVDAAQRARDPVYLALSDIFKDSALREPLQDLIAFLRKKVLREDYNMDAAIMARYTKEVGPFDWRHPQSHAFYWAKLGSEVGAERYQDVDDIYKSLNNDRLFLQAIQGLARTGLMTFDPLFNDNPTRLNDPRWINAARRYFRELYQHYYRRAQGGGPDTFAEFYENFLSASVRELWRAGEEETARQFMQELDELFGMGGVRPNTKYQRPIEVFVKEITEGEYEYVPDTAATDIYMALRNGFLQAYLRENPKRLEAARNFAAGIIEFFKTTHYFNFVNKFGEGRMKDLIADLDMTEERVFIALMKDTSLPLIDRLMMYNRAPEPVRRLAYDDAKEQLRGEVATSPIGADIIARTQLQGRPEEDAEKQLDQAFAAFFPEPPQMEEWRRFKAERSKRIEEERAGGRAEFKQR